MPNDSFRGKPIELVTVIDIVKQQQDMFDDGHSATAVVDEQIIFTASKVKGVTNNQISVLKRPAKKLG